MNDKTEVIDYSSTECDVLLDPVVDPCSETVELSSEARSILSDMLSVNRDDDDVAYLVVLKSEAKAIMDEQYRVSGDTCSRW